MQLELLKLKKKIGIGNLEKNIVRAAACRSSLCLHNIELLKQEVYATQSVIAYNTY